MTETSQDETPKRLAPTRETLRHIFAHSGNECAFDSCKHRLIDDVGNFVGEICHIEAAEPGGPRFNREMTNEEGRHRNNLLLMCHEHHVRTDDIQTYTVEQMRQIKSAHENQFAAIGAGVDEDTLEEVFDHIASSSIIDVTAANSTTYPKTLDRLFAEAYDSHIQDAEERAGNLRLVYELVDNLRRLPVDSRGVLQIIVSRADESADDLEVRSDEIHLVSNVAAEELYPHLHLLEKYDIVTLWDDTEVAYISMKALGFGKYGGDWPFWRDVKKFCAATDVSLERLVIDLRFDVLD